MLLRNPGWWTPRHDQLWERTAEALKQNWEIFYRRPGGRNGNSHATHAPPANGWEITSWQGPASHVVEEALRFGFGARLRYEPEYPMWGDALESRLRLDWEAMFPERGGDWEADVAAIRFAWHQEFEG